MFTLTEAETNAHFTSGAHTIFNHWIPCLTIDLIFIAPFFLHAYWWNVDPQQSFLPELLHFNCPLNFWRPQNVHQPNYNCNCHLTLMSFHPLNHLTRKKCFKPGCALPEITNIQPKHGWLNIYQTVAWNFTPS